MRHHPKITPIASDWSAQVVPAATLSHLDEGALKKAKEAFARKYANRFAADEIFDWPLESFLDRSKLTQEGKLTRTALLLLGKAESAYLLSPHPVQMTWKLEGAERAYEHFGPPFFLTTSESTGKFATFSFVSFLRCAFAGRSFQIRSEIILEALHNCIAHQDYTRNGRIVVTEQPDKLIFENEGSFFEGKPEDYVTGNKTPAVIEIPFFLERWLS